MASDPPNPSADSSFRLTDAELTFRQFPSGTIRLRHLSKGDTITTETDPAVIVHVGGRGRISWQDSPTASDDVKRGWGVIFLPPGATLHAHGNLRALEVTFPSLKVRLSAGQISEVLVGLLCRRAWHAPERIAETALKLVRLLIADEAEKSTLEDEIGE